MAINDTDTPIPDDVETMAVEFAARIRRLVLREVNQALSEMPDAQRKVRRLEWISRKRTDFELKDAVLQSLAEKGRALTFIELKKATYAPKGRLMLLLRALRSEKKISTVGNHRAKRYRLAG